MLVKEGSKLFQKIIVAYDDSPAGRDALSAGIELCKLLGTPLQTITVIEPPPIYTGLILAVAPDVAQDLESDRRRYHERLMEFAVAEGHRNSVEVTGHLVEAEEVDGVISFLRANGADLLVIGLRQHSSFSGRGAGKADRDESFGPIPIPRYWAKSLRYACSVALISRNRVFGTSA